MLGDNLRAARPAHRSRAAQQRRLVLPEGLTLKLFGSMTDAWSVTLVNLEEQVHKFVDPCPSA